MRVLRVKRLPISCFIIAKNEADRIGRAIRAVADWVDEVVVVDSGSTDGTQKLAEEAGGRVIFHDWPGFGQQKRFAEEQCRNDWLINVDADEVVSAALAGEIQQLFANGNPAACAYRLTINDVYPGQSRPRLWAHDYAAVRLYDRRQCRFKDSTLHDSVDIGSHRAVALRGDVHHFSFRTIEDLTQKVLARSHYNARHASLKPLWQLRFRLVFEFPLVFLKYYLDGYG
jgi:glycosyltransferase involved in cell wall biosynthesis